MPRRMRMVGSTTPRQYLFTSKLFGCIDSVNDITASFSYLYMYIYLLVIDTGKCQMPLYKAMDKEAATDVFFSTITPNF